MARVLIAPDKFKGTLTADAAAGAIANGWWSVRPADEVECLPISDGGDGFGALIGRYLEAEERPTRTTDAAGRPREAGWWWHAPSGTAVVETAQFIGLACLPPGKFHPYELDTFGLAAVIREVARAGAVRCLIGIGGSATNDGGFGFARGMGWKFSDANEKPIEKWIRLQSLARWQPPTDLPTGCDWVVAVDVQNPLLGPHGCTRVYGPQKGLRMEQAPLAESCLEMLANLARSEFGQDIALEPGTGAAGGLGFGLRTFLGARIENGFGIFAEQSQLAQRVSSVDLVITGEGMIDRSTLMGKGTGQLAKLCRDLGKPCIGLAGALDGVQALPVEERLFRSVHGIAPGMTSPTQAKAEAAKWLERLAGSVAAEWEV